MDQNIKSKIIELYQQHIKIAELQKQFHISKSHIYKILRDNNIIRNKFSEETLKREDAIIDDYQNGMIIQDILKKHKINDAASIYSILNKRKIKKRFESKRDVDSDYILKLYHENKSPHEIGKIINRSRAFIRRLLIKNNIKLRENGWFRNSKTSKIIKLYNNGMNTVQIAGQLNCSSALVSNILKANKITIRNSFPKFKNLCIHTNQIINKYKNGKSSCTIAEEIGCSDVAILHLLRNNNIEIRKNAGETHSQWKGGITPLHILVRTCTKNNQWKINCFKNSRFRGKINQIDKRIQCHHIYPFKDILQSSLTKHKFLNLNLCRLAIVNDERFFDIDNGLVLTEEEHNAIEKSSRNCHPYWKIWKVYPDLALSYFPFSIEQYNTFDENGTIDASKSKITSISLNFPELRKIIRYEHYLGTVPPHKIILIGHINQIITGIAIFGYGANKNIPQNYWELSRLCVPHYVIRPFTIDFLNQCISYIKNNYTNIEKIIAYSDPNVGHDGAIYRMGGWEKEGKTRPSYCYFDPTTNQLRHKSYCRRVKGIDKTERQLATKRGLIRIELSPLRKYSRIIS